MTTLKVLVVVRFRGVQRFTCDRIVSYLYIEQGLNGDSKLSRVAEPSHDKLKMNTMELVICVARVMDNVNRLFGAMNAVIWGIYASWNFEFGTW